MEKELFEAVKKRALGFFETEENLEFERVVHKGVIYCQKRKKIYTKFGFVSVRDASKDFVLPRAGVRFVACRSFVGAKFVLKPGNCEK